MRSIHGATTQPTGPLVEAARTLVITGTGKMRTIPLPDEGSVTIGRAEDCDIVLTEPAVSRRHLTLHLGSSIEVEDGGSANGTKLGDTRLVAKRRVAIQVGAALHIGSLTLMVYASGDQPAAPRARKLTDELRSELDKLEKQKILDTLAACGGNQTRAAEELGISRRTLTSRLGEYAVPRPRKR